MNDCMENIVKKKLNITSTGTGRHRLVTIDVDKYSLYSFALLKIIYMRKKKVY